MKNSDCTHTGTTAQKRDLDYAVQMVSRCVVEARNAYAAAAVAEEDAQRREDDGEDDFEAGRAAAGAHPAGARPPRPQKAGSLA
jgi:hypothetical protein